MPNKDAHRMTHSSTQGVVAADQRQLEPVPVLVGPTTADEFNTIGERLLPKGCFRFEDVRFEFGSSFVRPEVADELPLFADLREKHTLKLDGKEIPPPCSIFGHADPVGNDDYNKKLSGRRAQAIYGMLVRDVELWEDLYTNPLGNDNWGDPAVQTMLDKVAVSSGSDGGTTDTQNQDRVKAFQKANGLKDDGIVGPKTRRALYRAYMDELCGRRLLLDKEKDFLAHHKDSGGKGDYQGCGEFNPVMMFSEEENTRYEKASDKTERNQDNAPNRRVMVLLYAPGRRVNPELWPCPRVKEGIAACKKRFFPDAEHRRSFQEERREFSQKRDTYACRFYQIITDDSPCEGLVDVVRLRIRLIDVNGQPLAGLAYELELDGAFKIVDSTDGDGMIDKVIPAQSKIGTLNYNGIARSILITSLDDASTVSGAQPRIVNLGCGGSEAQPGVLDETTRRMLQRFQTHYNLKTSGALDNPTVNELRKQYGS